MRQWEMLYERPPLARDAALLLLAMVLHAPLGLIHMDAPPKSKNRALPRLVNIDFMEEQIKKKKEKAVVLPPKIPDAPKQMKEAVKKAVDVPKIFRRPPPPPPQAKVPTDILRGPEPAKLNDKLMRDKLEQEKKLLAGRANFQAKDMRLSGPNASQNLKIAEGAALQASPRLAGAGGPAGATLKGKSGFQVSKDALPASIGGDDGLKVAGEPNIVVVPTGARARADASVLSPVARDRGSFQGQAGGAAQAAPSAMSAGLAGGSGPASSISVGGRTGAPAGGAAAPLKTGKKFEGAAPSPAGTGASRPAASLAAPGLPALPRRTAVQKPMFVITGPLQNRQVINRHLPSYPDWARQQGLDATVVLEFTVTTEGRVKDNIQVVRTSGDPRMDQLAMDALRKWTFAPLPEGKFEDQVGTITFNFSVR